MAMAHQRRPLFRNVVALSFPLLVLVLGGCEGMYSARASKEQDELAKKFAPEPTGSVIYVYRPSATEFPRAIFLYDNGAMVASLEAGSFVRLVVTPGNHVIGTKSPSARSLQDELTVAADTGQLFYAQVSYQSRGATGDSPKLRQVDEKAAQEEIRGCNLRVTGPLD